MLRDTVGPAAPYPHLALMACLGQRLALAGRNMRPPNYTPNYAAALTRANGGFPARSFGSNKEATTTQGQMPDQDALGEQSSNIR